MSLYVQTPHRPKIMGTRPCVRLIFTIIVLFLAIHSPLSAETDGVSLPELFETQGLQLRHAGPEFSQKDFEYTTHRNQHMLIKSVKGLMNDNLESMGTTGTVIKFTGETAYMAVKSAKFNLNNSKTMAIEANHFVDSDREIVFSINISW